jgi:hypothetical protein
MGRPPVFHYLCHSGARSLNRNLEIPDRASRVRNDGAKRYTAAPSRALNLSPRLCMGERGALTRFGIAGETVSAVSANVNAALALSAPVFRVG